MAAKFSSAILAFTAVILIISVVPAAAGRRGHHFAAKDLPHTGLCSHVDYPFLCQPVIRSVTDPKEATKIAIADLYVKTKKAKSGMTPYIPGNRAVTICHEKFNDALDSMDKALSGIAAHDLDAINANLGWVLSDYGTCINLFEESAQFNKVTNVAVRLRKKASNVLALSTKIR